MTITPEVKRQFFAHDGERSHIIRLPPAAVASPVGPNRRVGRPWTKDEHERFLEGLQLFPNGPWRCITTHVGTRTVRQTMTHAQKYRQRISRLLVPPRCLQSSPPAMPTAPLPCGANANELSQCGFDALDLEILSSLLNDSDAASGDSSSSPCGTQDYNLDDLLHEAEDD